MVLGGVVVVVVIGVVLVVLVIHCGATKMGLLRKANNNLTGEGRNDIKATTIASRKC